MKTPLTLTVVIRGPVYALLVAELSAFSDPRARAGWLKRLAEDGARAACTEASGLGLDLSRMATIPQAGHECLSFDMRVAIRQEEFPSLHATLEVERDPRARATLLKRFAEEALRWHHNQSARLDVGERLEHRPVPQATNTESRLDLLSLSAGMVPSDLLAAFGVNTSIE
ncbi:hypothetical protein PTE30175_03534 [Pandoraea terrae]|uniref:Uncharacterized protein n=1 Tax=Pandoraea terrae TaxID=1537710 RepID=A0A5E4X2W3_9BURK|nr:hypothetical protein [Pandoraea terrae]VVE30619.1 hypothetical protein PTE30175_03534 [Pandoraea terrae]